MKGRINIKKLKYYFCILIVIISLFSLKTKADNTPLGQIMDIDGNVITTDATNKGFYFKCNMENKTDLYYQYRGPLTNKWELYEECTVFDTAVPIGKHYFRIMDSIGQVSSVYSILFETEKPTMEICDGTNFYYESVSLGSSYFYVDGVDIKSGIKDVYVKKPNSFEYTNYGRRTFISESGEYLFYAVDYAGNYSDTYKVIFDNEKPIINSSLGSMNVSTESNFSVFVSDMSSCVLYYKTPTMTAYQKANDTNYSVDYSDPIGKYYFYARDYYGHLTDFLWIEKTKIIPKVDIIKNDSDNTIYITWEEQDFIVKVNGELYQKETIITDEGSYQVVVVDSYDNQGEYTFEINHCYKIQKVVEPTCSSNGYTIYYCISCNNIIEQDFTSKTSHNLANETIPPTCTNYGYLLSTCKNCDYLEQNNLTDALGHDFIIEERTPNCIADGGIFNICRRCGYSEGLDVIEKFGHQYESMLVDAATCYNDGLRVYQCKVCSDEYQSIISAIEHQYILLKEDKVDNEIIQTYKCQLCGNEKTKNLTKDYEALNNTLNETSNFYKDNLIIILVICTSIWSIFMGVEYILAIRKEDKVLAKKRIINYVLGLIVIFIVLVVCPLLVQGISSLFN